MLFCPSTLRSISGRALVSGLRWGTQRTPSSTAAALELGLELAQSRAERGGGRRSQMRSTGGHWAAAALSARPLDYYGNYH